MTPFSAMTDLDRSHKGQMEEIRHQIATVAAKLIAEDGATYAIAKSKAAQQVLGKNKAAQEVLPDNETIDQQIHVYNQLFLSHSQPQRLLHLRTCALKVMQELAQFMPHLTGAVLNGTAGEHSEIVLHLFVDNTKDVAIYLLNKGIQFDVSESHSQQTNLPKNKGRAEPQETLSFMLHNEVIHLILFSVDDLRNSSAKKTPRATIEALQLLIEESKST